jgi:hypothetical protein
MALFHAPAWTWPTGDHHSLIYAVAGQNTQHSLDGLKHWLGGHDLDDAAFREQRLLFAAFARHGASLKEDPVYPRLMGLQRMLWTRAQMSLRQNLPSVRNLESSGIAVLFIKGAGMAALPYVSSRQRISHDLDIVVKQSDFARAFEILGNDHWLPSSGQSRLCLTNQFRSLRGINMFRDRFGDIDLHSRPFHFSQGGLAQDQGLWDRSRTGYFGGEAVLIASAEDALAIAIGHGSLDGHTHSDWLIDVARLISNEAIDWALFVDIVKERALTAPAYFALSYVAEKLKIDIPHSVTSKLHDDASTSAQGYMLSLIQMRPRDRFLPPGHLLRWLAKTRRKKLDRNLAPAPAENQRFLQVKVAGHAQAAEANYQTIALVKCKLSTQSSRIELELQIGPVKVARRIEFELNTATKHLARFNVRLLRPRTQPFRIIVKGTIALVSGEDLFVEARPSRQLRDQSDAKSKMLYDEVKFSLLRSRFLK